MNDNGKFYLKICFPFPPPYCQLSCERGRWQVCLKKKSRRWRGFWPSVGAPLDIDQLPPRAAWFHYVVSTLPTTILHLLLQLLRQLHIFLQCLILIHWVNKALFFCGGIALKSSNIQTQKNNGKFDLKSSLFKTRFLVHQRRYRWLWYTIIILIPSERCFVFGENGLLKLQTFFPVMAQHVMFQNKKIQLAHPYSGTEFVQKFTPPDFQAKNFTP